MDKKAVLQEATEQYNAMARVWNSLPGNKLRWPEDKFKIKYCEHKTRGKAVDENAAVKACYRCGLPFPGEWN